MSVFYSGRMVRARTRRHHKSFVLQTDITVEKHRRAEARESRKNAAVIAAAAQPIMDMAMLNEALAALKARINEIRSKA